MRSHPLRAVAWCISVSVVMSVALPQDKKEGEKKDKADAIAVDKDKKTITVPCKIAPRKLPNLNEIYPIEVIACWPAPKGQKAHETVVVYDAKPSEIHKAVESLGLKAGKPAR